MSVELLSHQGADEGLGGNRPNQLKMFGTIVVALEEVCRHGDIYETAREQRAAGHDIEFKLLGHVQ